jgi:hypothetical protein
MPTPAVSPETGRLPVFHSVLSLSFIPIFAAKKH